MSAKVQAKVTHRFESSAERIYDAWLNPDKARHWLEAALVELGLEGDIKRVEIDPRVDGTFFFSDQREGGEARHWGTYLELDRPHKIVFTWITDESEKNDPSQVTLMIEPDGQGCIAGIVHEMDAKWADYLSQTQRGWGAMLKSVDALSVTSN